jgi:hypothetical protein
MHPKTRMLVATATKAIAASRGRNRSTSFGWRLMTLRALACVALAAAVVHTKVVVGAAEVEKGASESSPSSSSHPEEEDVAGQPRQLRQPRRGQQGGGVVSSTSGTAVDAGQGREEEELEPLVRVWVSYKANVTHNESLGSLQTNLEQALALPPNATNFDGLLVPDKDVGGVPPTRRKRTRGRQLQPEEIVASSFQMHYDFFETASGVGSIAMSVTPTVLEALQNDPNVRRVRIDPPRSPLHAVDEPETEQESALPPLDGAVDADADAGVPPRRLVKEQTPYGVRMVRAPAAWRKGFQGQGVIVRTERRKGGVLLCSVHCPSYLTRPAHCALHFCGSL